MPNQMIALQSRGPKLPDPASQTARYVNMMNMAKQQEAAERQAAMAQETLKLQQEKGAREEALQGPALASAKTGAEAAQLKYVMDFFNASASDIANSSTPEQAIARGERLKQQFTDPALQARIDETIGELVSDPNQFEANRKRILIRTMNAKEQFAVTHSDIFDAEGNLLNKETSPVGAFPTRITPGVVTDLPSTATQTTGGVVPRATPTAAPQVSAMGRAPSATSEAPMTFGPDETRPLNAYQQEDLERLQGETGMANTPASFARGGMGTPTAGQMTPDMVPAILDSAVNTGVMAQIDLDQMLAMAPPQAKQGIMDVIRSNNITLQPNAPSLTASTMGQQQPMAANPVQRPQAQFADMRGPTPQSQTAGLRGAPPMEQTLAQYQVGQQVKGRNPNVSPYPGSAQVPIERVRQEAVAGRETPAEAAAKARAVAQATAATETEKKAAEKAPGRKQVSTIIKKIRGAYEQLEKNKAIASEKRGGFANVMDYLATTSPGREVQKALGTSASKYLSEIVNSRKLLATAIKNATGMSAQEMNSNVELQLTLDALTDPTQGIEAARSTLDTLEELYGAPRTAPTQNKRRTSTSTLSAETRAKYGL